MVSIHKNCIFLSVTDLTHFLCENWPDLKYHFSINNGTERREYEKDFIGKDKLDGLGVVCISNLLLGAVRIQLGSVNSRKVRDVAGWKHDSGGNHRRQGWQCLHIYVRHAQEGKTRPADRL
jgi:hypothetical protein